MRWLARSRTDRWIAGVCGGLGAYFAIDSNAVRLAFALLTLWNGLGALLYALLVLIMPDAPLAVPATAPELPPPIPAAEVEPQRRSRMLGAMAIFGGLLLLLHNTPLFAALFQARGFADILAVVLVVAGVLILLLRPNRL